MGVVRRVTASLRTRANRVLDRFEDPVETFELARRRQTEMLAEVRQQLADDEAERRRIEAAPGVGDRAKELALRHRVLLREEKKLRELEARLQGRITEFGTLIETTKASRTVGAAGGFGDDDAVREMTENVEAELRRLDAEIRRHRT